jgi:hypothetical protein
MARQKYSAVPLKYKEVEGISARTFAEHFKLYEGYVNKTNEIYEKIANNFADPSKSAGTYSEYGEAKTTARALTSTSTSLSLTTSKQVLKGGPLFGRTRPASSYLEACQRQQIICSSRAIAPLTTLHSRHYASSSTEASTSSFGSNFGLKYTGVQKFRLYSATSFGLLAAVPLAIVLPPPLVSICDIAFNILLPLHTHIGLHHVIEDYVPRSLQKSMILVLWVATLLAFCGLLKLNLKGEGITTTTKKLWKKPKPAKE